MEENAKALNNFLESVNSVEVVFICVDAF